MNQKVNLIVAVAAGLAGSVILNYIAPMLSAQNQAPVAREMRAQSFVLVDPSNNIIGTFSSEPAPSSTLRVVPGISVTGPSHIVLRDRHGRVIWTPDDTAKILPLTSR